VLGTPQHLDRDQLSKLMRARSTTRALARYPQVTVTPN
jgi:hypothetical protein